jgi:hypothetical protein
MASTVTRRVVRRFRLGGRHTYRALRRNRVTAVIAAVVLATVAGTAAVATGEHPVYGDRPAAMGHMHSMPDGMPGQLGARRD